MKTNELFYIQFRLSVQTSFVISHSTFLTDTIEISTKRPHRSDVDFYLLDQPQRYKAIDNGDCPAYLWGVFIK
ncbi:MAG: hypothetical protein AUK34_02625 [Ignavibacteria bacterium CG2_30_36_16]|nr:hypothetical protein [Ignavibacteria bacterium]OIP62919.1 MAG: hypothetical protein AUK34_02625 [Ignavibacteria bacterium CG2_30_36_16]